MTEGFSNRRSDLTWGVGVNFQFSKNLGARGEWERFKDAGDHDTTGRTDIDLFSLGLTYTF